MPRRQRATPRRRREVRLEIQFCKDFSPFAAPDQNALQAKANLLESTDASAEPGLVQTETVCRCDRQLAVTLLIFSGPG
jgi:hypothetical protein